MGKRILVILAHPAQEHHTFGAALADAYTEGATSGDNEVRHLAIAQLEFDPILHEGYRKEQPLEPDLVEAQRLIKWADHLVFIYPMWQFMIPALLKGFLERVFQRGFAFHLAGKNPLKAGMLDGKSARLIQTMGMPAWAYRWIFRAHGARAFRQILRFCAISPVRISYFGTIEGSGAARQQYLQKAQSLGLKGQ